MILQTGDIVLYHNFFRWKQPVTWLAAIERWVTGCDYEHAGVIVDGMINEALGSGIESRPFNVHLQREGSMVMVLRPHSISSDFVVRANFKVGTAYGISGLFEQLIYRVFGRWFGHTNRKRMICTQYVAWCFGIRDWYKYTAKELMAMDGVKVIYKD